MKKYFLFLAMGALLALSANKMSAQIAQGTTGSLMWVLTDDSVLTISGSGAMPNYYNSANSPWYANRTQIKSAVIRDSVTSIGDWAFFGSNLTSVTIGNSIMTIGKYAFGACRSLTSVTIPNSVTSIGDLAFFDCSSLTAIDVVADNPNYSSINSVLFNKNQTELNTYPAGKSGVYSIPNSVTSIRAFAFWYCSSLTSVTIPNSVTTIGGNAFLSCSSLTAIDVVADNPNYSSIGGVLFNKDQTTLIQYPGGKSDAYSIPNSVTTIRGAAFYGCSSLTSVTIPNSVTMIGESAFSNCVGLTSVTIPHSVTTIGDIAFAYCSSLAEIINFNPTPIGIDADVFLNVNIPTCILKVPTGSLSAYRAADVWKDFLNIEEISVSIAEAQHTEPLQIYPNPVVNGQLTISNGEGQAEIYTVQGVRVGSYSLTDKETSINVSHLASGMYFVKVGNTVKKLIINK